MNKFKYLDGIRGVAALIVVFHHYILGFLPALLLPQVGHAYTRYDWTLTGTPLGILISGHFAVCMFFVLSGYVLSFKFFKTGLPEIVIGSAMRRYVRLVIPVFFSILVAYVLMELHLFRNVQMGPTTLSTMWLSKFFTFDPEFYGMLKNSFYEVFFQGNDRYNENLWTMQIELYGSFIVFAFLLLFGKMRNRAVVYAALIYLFSNTFYMGFILGMLMSDIMNNPRVNRSVLYKRPVKAALLGAGIYIASLPSDPLPMFRPVMELFKGLNPYIAGPIVGSCLILIAVLHSDRLQQVFSARPFYFLGKISFSMYVIHLAVICSFSSWLLGYLLKFFSYSISVPLMLLVSLPFLLLISHYINKYVDMKGVQLATYLYRKFFQIPKTDAGQQVQEMKMAVAATKE